MAVPPLLSVNVGVPLVVLTNTTSLMLRVNVAVLPTPMSPEPAVMPEPDVVTDDTDGVVVLICGPVWVRPVSDRLAAFPAASRIVPELRLTAVAARLAVFCPVATV